MPEAQKRRSGQEKVQKQAMAARAPKRSGEAKGESARGAKIPTDAENKFPRKRASCFDKSLSLLSGDNAQTNSGDLDDDIPSTETLVTRQLQEADLPNRERRARRIIEQSARF